MTASKAIIEKEYQPHVIVSTAGPNPFSTLTDRELEEYRREVQRKQKGPGGEHASARVLGESWARWRRPHRWRLELEGAPRLLLCARVLTVGDEVRGSSEWPWVC